MSTVYVNGRYVASDEASISVHDRGFLFADGLYEVTPAYEGRFFRMDRHMARLARGLDALRIDFDPGELVEVHARLMIENDLIDAEAAIVYVQVTRGAAPRTHAFPDPPVRPTVYAAAREYVRPDAEAWEHGSKAITVPDRRWGRVDIKSVALLPNVLAQQAAVDAGAKDALLVRDGVALEGSHNNFFAVFDGVVVTHPATNTILHGITREYVLELAREREIPVVERAIMVEELASAEEAFFTGTTTEIRPCVEIDGRPVGKGVPGPIAKRLQGAFTRGVTER